MYTISTTAIRYVIEKLGTAQDPLPSLVHDMEGCIAAYVGTQEERAKVLISPHVRFFELDASDDALMSQAILYVPVDAQGNKDTDNPTTWATAPIKDPVVLPVPIPRYFYTTYIVPAGGYANAVYQIPRGELADIDAVPQYPGLLYYSEDTRELYCWAPYYTPTPAHWQRLTKADDPIGIIFIYPTAFGPAPAGFLRCDGHVMTAAEQAMYPTLYGMLGTEFGVAGTLPTEPNGIIKAL